MDRASSSRTGKKDDALLAYSKVLRIDSAHPNDRGGAQVWIGALHYERGNYDEAKKALQAAANADGVHPADKQKAQDYLRKIGGAKK